MKKLIATMAAIVTGFAAWAALPSYTSFEGSDEFSDGALVVNGTTSWSTNGAPTLTQATYGEGEAYPYTPGNARYTEQFTSANTAYLNIKTTFGQPLERTIGETVGSDAVYFDQLVKFTAADEEPNLELYTGEKLVIYVLDKSELETPVATTNLMVVAGRYDNNVLTNMTYDFGPIDVAAWHRLTIKAIKAYNNTALGFEIFLDGAAPQYLGSVKAYDGNAVSYLTTGAAALNQAQKIVASLVPSTLTIAAVGFDGQGAIDDVMATTTSPGTWADDKNVTLRWTPAQLEALSYTAHGQTTTLDATGLAVGMATIPYMADMTIVVNPTFAQNWEFDTFDGEGFSFSGLTLTELAENANPTLVARDTTPRVSVSIDALTPTTYPSLLAALEAVNALQSGTAVITLNENLTLGKRTIEDGDCSEGMIESAADVTIDLNGHTITGPADYAGHVLECLGNVTIIDSQNNTGRVLPSASNEGAVFYRGALQVSGGTFDGTIDADDQEGTPTLSVTGGKFIYSDFTDENDDFTLASAVQTGYTYATDSEQNPTYWEVTALPSYTLTVTPTANATYVLTVGGETVSTAEAEAGVSVREGTAYSLTATAAEYYNYNGVTTTNITAAMGSAALVLAVPAPTADVWTIMYYDGSTEFATDTYTIENRASKALNAGEKSGYTLDYWEDEDGNEVTSLEEDEKTGDLNLYGVWTQNPEPPSGHTVTIKWSTAPLDNPFRGVKFSIGGSGEGMGTPVDATNDVPFIVAHGVTLRIVPEMIDWYQCTGGTAEGGDTITNDVTYALVGAPLAAADFTGDDSAAEAATKAGITSATLIAGGKDAVVKAVLWAETHRVQKDIVNAMVFEGNDANTREEKAYLFNVYPSDEAVAEAEANFKFPSITPGEVPSIPEASTYNGTVTVKGCDTVNGTYVAPATTSHKFYKAELLLPAADPVAN